MMYRSSVATFAKALSTEAAAGHATEIRWLTSHMKEKGISFRAALSETLLEGDLAYMKAAKAAIPDTDWEEIMGYLERYHEAYGFQAVANAKGGVIFYLVPWVASVAVCALDDIGR